MKKLFILSIAVLFLAGCALTTIKPYEQEVQAPAPEKKSFISNIIKPAPKPAPPVVKEAEEDIK